MRAAHVRRTYGYKYGYLYPYFPIYTLYSGTLWRSKILPFVRARTCALNLQAYLLLLFQLMMSSSRILSSIIFALIYTTSYAFAPVHFSSCNQRSSIINTQHTSHNKISLFASSTNDNEEEIADKDGNVDQKKEIYQKIFWAQQKALAAEMSSNIEGDVRQENRDKFAKRRLALTSDTFYFSILIASVLWIIYSNPFVTLSYLFGALSGTAYSYGLGKYVESIGGSIDDVEVEGAGVGQARFAFLILLFVVVGKFRSQGLLEIPSIMGFFTYQLASLNQGLKEIDD